MFGGFRAVLLLFSYPFCSSSRTWNEHSQLDAVLGSAVLTLLVFDTEMGKKAENPVVASAPGALQNVIDPLGPSSLPFPAGGDTDLGLSPHPPASLVRILLEGRLGSPIPRMLLAKTRNS